MLSHQQSDYRIKFNIIVYIERYRKKNQKKMNKEKLMKLRNSVKELDKEIEIKLKNDLAKNKEFVNSRR